MTKKSFVIMTLLIFLILTFSNEFDSGVKFYKDGDFKNALSSFQNIKQKDSRVYFNIGNCFFRLKKLPEAAAYYLKSIRLDPGLKDALQNLRLIAGEDIVFHSTIFIPFPRSAVYTVNLLFLFILLLFTFVKLIKKKKGISHVQITIAVLTIILSFYSLFAYVNSLKEFAVINQHSEVLSSPSSDGVQIAEVFAGNVMYVEIRGKNYSKIKNHQGISGWMKNSELIFIEDL